MRGSLFDVLRTKNNDYFARVPKVRSCGAKKSMSGDTEINYGSECFSLTSYLQVPITASPTHISIRQVSFTTLSAFQCHKESRIVVSKKSQHWRMTSTTFTTYTYNCCAIHEIKCFFQPFEKIRPAIILPCVELIEQKGAKSKILLFFMHSRYKFVEEIYSKDPKSHTLSGLSWNRHCFLMEGVHLYVVFVVLYTSFRRMHWIRRFWASRSVPILERK